jgi:hypothetical protein
LPFFVDGDPNRIDAAHLPLPPCDSIRLVC